MFDTAITPLHVGRKKGSKNKNRKEKETKAILVNRKQGAIKKAILAEERKKGENEKQLNYLSTTLPEFVGHLRLENEVQNEINNVEEEEKGSEEEAYDDEEIDPPPELEEWDHLSLPANFFLVLEGKRRTGKSTFARWLLQYYKDRFELAWVMTKTKANGYWQKIVGSAFVFPDYDPMAIREVVRRNDTIIEKYGTDSVLTKLKASTLIILDDVVSSRIHDDPTFTMMACEGRHHNLSIILLTQDPKAIGPKVRDNADGAIIFNMKTQRNKETMWADFMNDVDKKTAHAILERYAVGHDALFCSQCNLNSDIKKNFYKITGDGKMDLEFPNYSLGGKKQKEMIEDERRKKAEIEIGRKNDTKQTIRTIKLNPNSGGDKLEVLEVKALEALYS